MKLEYKKRIYWLLRFILIVCVVNVLTGFYDMCTSSKNTNVNQIIWKGERYNKDKTGYHSIDKLKYLVDIPTDCDVKDIWAVASYYAKDDSECDTRLKELKGIYDEGGAKAIVDDIMSKDVGDDKKTMMEYLIVDGCLIESLDNDAELLNNVLEHCYDRDYGFLGYKRYIDIGNKLYKKNRKLERIIESFETLSKYTTNRAGKLNVVGDSDDNLVDRKHYSNMIQLLQTFSSLSYFDGNLLGIRPTIGNSKNKYIVKAVKEDYDIVLSYKKYKSFINFGNISIYGRYKNLNMRIKHPVIGHVEKFDVMKYVAPSVVGKVVDKLFDLNMLSREFELWGTNVIVYDIDIHTPEGFNYGFYPMYKIYNIDDMDTKRYIDRFNEYFLPGGEYEEERDKVGYNPDNPISEEDFAERIDEINSMVYELFEVRYH